MWFLPQSLSREPWRVAAEPAVCLVFWKLTFVPVMPRSRWGPYTLAWDLRPSLLLHGPCGRLSLSSLCWPLHLLTCLLHFLPSPAQSLQSPPLWFQVMIFHTFVFLLHPLTVEILFCFSVLSLFVPWISSLDVFQLVKYMEL